MRYPTDPALFAQLQNKLNGLHNVLIHRNPQQILAKDFYQLNPQFNYASDPRGFEWSDFFDHYAPPLGINKRKVGRLVEFYL